MVRSHAVSLALGILALLSLATTGCSASESDADTSSDSGSALGGEKKNLCTFEPGEADATKGEIAIGLAESGKDTMLILDATRDVGMADGRVARTRDVRTVLLTGKSLAETRKLLGAKNGVWTSLTDGMTDVAFARVERMLWCRNEKSAVAALMSGRAAYNFGAEVCTNGVDWPASGERMLRVSEVPEGALAYMAEPFAFPASEDLAIATGALERSVYVEGAKASDLLDALSTPGSEAAVSAWLGAPLAPAEVAELRSGLTCKGAP